MLSMDEIRQLFVYEYLDENFVIDKTGVKCLEVLGTSFIANEKTIFGKVNKEYIEKELMWYMSQSLNVYDMIDPPAIWKQVADVDGLINSNYGWCIFSENNNSQYKHARIALLSNKDTRRATMIYTRPSIQRDYNKCGMSDFICTNAVNYFIRDNKLNCVVQMRSNDIFAGYRNDYAWQDFVLEFLLDDLKAKYPKLEKGNIIWNAASLHMYEKQFGLIKKYIKTGKYE